MSVRTEAGPGDAEVRHRRWPGLVWAIPLGVLLVVLWLGLRALTHPGVTVHLDVPQADGIRTGDTHVTLNGMEVGSVRAIAIAPDPRFVRLTLRIKGDAGRLLRAGTLFWVVGAKPNLTDLSSLRATISGPSIGMVPGPGAPRRDFVAVDTGPAIAPGTAGTHFRLVAPDLVSIGKGTSLYTHGWQVGTVLGLHAFGPAGFMLDAFVRAPFDRLVRADTHFWDASALQLTRGAGGLEARLTSPEIAAVGGVSFETPDEARDAPRAPADTRFQLYPDAATAHTAPVGVEMPYQLAFTGPVGEVQRGAPVIMNGFTVGRVLSRRLMLDAATGRLATPVTIALDPARLRLPADRAAVDRAVARMVARGLHARLDQSPPIVGSRLVTLAFGGARGRLRPGTPGPWLPVANGGDVADLSAQASSILSKVDAIPIRQIGQSVAHITAHLDTITGSPQLRSSLDHLHGVLATLDRTAQADAPKIGPLLDSLRATADQAGQTATAARALLGDGAASQDGDIPSAIRQLTEATRSLRSLADYLSRHPEALLKGRKAK